MASFSTMASVRVADSVAIDFEDADFVEADLEDFEAIDLEDAGFAETDLAEADSAAAAVAFVEVVGDVAFSKAQMKSISS